MRSSRARLLGGRRHREREAHEAFGRAKRKRREKQRIDGAEDGRVRADADGERRDGDHREQRRAREGAEGEGRVLRERVDHVEARDAACFLAIVRRVAKTPARPVARGPGRQRPARRVLPLARLGADEEFHLFGQFPLVLPRSCEHAQPVPDRIDERHVVSSRWAQARRSTRLMATSIASKLVDLVAELAAAGRGERVVARAAAGRRFAPPRRDPAFLLEALEGGIERALLDAAARPRTAPRSVARCRSRAAAARSASGGRACRACP